jgi:hypothetical protein
VSEQGAPDELRQNDGWFSRFIRTAEAAGIDEDAAERRV